MASFVKICCKENSKTAQPGHTEPHSKLTQYT